MARPNFFDIGYRLGQGWAMNDRDKNMRLAGEAEQDFQNAANNYNFAEGMRQANAQSNNPAVRAMANQQQDSYIGQLLNQNPYAANMVADGAGNNNVGSVDVSNVSTGASAPNMAGAVQIQPQQANTSARADYQQPATYRGGIRTYDATGPNSFTATHSPVNEYNVDTSVNWDSPEARRLVQLKYAYDMTDDLRKKEQIAGEAQAVRQQAEQNNVMLPAELRSSSNAGLGQVLESKQAHRQALQNGWNEQYKTDPEGAMKAQQSYWQNIRDSYNPMKAINNNVSAGNPIDDSKGGTPTATQEQAMQREAAQNGNASFPTAPANQVAPAVEQKQVQSAVEAMNQPTQNQPQSDTTMNPQLQNQAQASRLTPPSQNTQASLDSRGQTTPYSQVESTPTGVTQQVATTPTQAQVGVLQTQSTDSSQGSYLGNNILDPNYKQNLYQYLRSKGYSTPDINAYFQQSGLDGRIASANSDYWSGIYNNMLAAGNYQGAMTALGKVAGYNKDMASVLGSGNPSNRDAWNQMNTRQNAAQAHKYRQEDIAQNQKFALEKAELAAKVKSAYAAAQNNAKSAADYNRRLMKYQSLQGMVDSGQMTEAQRVAYAFGDYKASGSSKTDADGNPKPTKADTQLHQSFVNKFGNAWSKVINNDPTSGDDIEDLQQMAKEEYDKGKIDASYYDKLMSKISAALLVRAKNAGYEDEATGYIQNIDDETWEKYLNPRGLWK